MLIDSSLDTLDNLIDTLHDRTSSGTIKWCVREGGRVFTTDLDDIKVNAYLRYHPAHPVYGGFRYYILDLIHADNSLIERISIDDKRARLYFKVTKLYTNILENTNHDHP